jgi:hypothetical protein
MFQWHGEILARAEDGQIVACVEQFCDGGVWLIYLSVQRGAPVEAVALEQWLNSGRADRNGRSWSL